MYEIFEKLMNERGITHYRVWKDTGVAQSTLSEWKDGKSAPKSPNLAKLADYFGVTVDYLMGRAEEDTKKDTPVEVSDDDIMFALFGGDADEITDEMYEDVKNYAQYIKDKKRKKGMK